MIDENINTACAYKVNIEARRGDSFLLDFFFEDDEGNPIDLSGFEFFSSIMPVIFTAPNQLTIKESAEKMVKRPVSVREYSIWKEKNGRFVKTMVSGLFNVIKDNR